MQFQAAADALRSRGVTVAAVGTAGVDPAFLDTLATSSAYKMVTFFSALASDAPTIVNTACQAPGRSPI